MALTRKEKLELIRDQLLDALIVATLNPKPDYELEGQIMSWSEYTTGLFDKLQQIENKIERLGEVTITWLGTDLEENN